jgi:hypothetical protein
MRAMRSRHVRRALKRLKIDPLVVERSAELPPGRALAHLRHEATNYDELLDAYRFQAHEYKMFKWAVNQRILEAME